MEHREIDDICYVTGHFSEMPDPDQPFKGNRCHGKWWPFYSTQGCWIHLLEKFRPARENPISSPYWSPSFTLGIASYSEVDLYELTHYSHSHLQTLMNLFLFLEITILLLSVVKILAILSNQLKSISSPKFISCISVNSVAFIHQQIMDILICTLYQASVGETMVNICTLLPSWSFAS